MVLKETPTCNFDEKAFDFKLIGTDEKIWTLTDCAGTNGTLIMFICNHCPYVKAIQSKLVEDARKLLEVGIKSVAIMSNDPQDYPEDSFENMKKISEKYNYPFPYLFDETQEVAKTYDAVCTPDFFGYNKSLELQYRGRFDETGMTSSKNESNHDLLEAMIMVAKTSKGPQKQIPSMGCSIKWKI
ncbi:MAG: thioredoxin family protein [Legionellales bacterium]|nr:thioredoxin family protein [Legionellales bacterium]